MANHLLDKVNATPPSASEKYLAAFFLALFAGADVILFLFDPEQHSFFPQCPFHDWTGLECPGCGTLRALHQLFHGHLVAALKFNALAVAFLPVAAWLLAREIARIYFDKAWPGLVTKPSFGWSVAMIAILFGILRNIPRPH